MQETYVKHPHFKPEDLNGKRLAYIENGQPYCGGQEMHVHEPLRVDEYYKLSITLVNVGLPSTLTGETSGGISTIYLDQKQVDKIVKTEDAPEVGIRAMPCEYWMPLPLR